MKNLNAFFKLCQIRNGITISKMASQLSLDKGYLSRTFNNKNHLRKERNIHKICTFFDLDMDFVFQTNHTFESLCMQFKHAFYYCDDKVHDLYQEILAYQKTYEWKSPYYIDILIIRLMYETEVKHHLPAFIDYLNKIWHSLCEQDQITAATYFVLADVLFPGQTFEAEEAYFQMAASLPAKDKHIQARLYYFGLSYARQHNHPKLVKKCYLLALNAFKNTGNFIMLEKLFMKYSALLRSYGKFERAAHNDELLIETFQRKQLQLNNLEVLYNNLAWTYSLLHNYAKAIDYYQKAIVSLKDNEIYFNLAFCCYKTGHKADALHYIELGKEAKSYGEYVFLLLEWLEAMIQKRYSKKSYMILMKIKKGYFHDLEVMIKDFIQLEIINYLYFTKQYEQAFSAYAPLLNRRIDSPTQSIIQEENRLAKRKRK